MPERFILRGWGCRGGWAGACFYPYPGCAPPAPCAAGDERTAVQSAELGSGRASSWVELSSFAPSIASGQEAEPRVDRLLPNPCCLAPGPPPPHSACAPQLARCTRTSTKSLPQIPAPELLPGDPARSALPAFSATAGRVPQCAQGRAGAHRDPPTGSLGRSARGPH